MLAPSNSHAEDAVCPVSRDAGGPWVLVTLRHGQEAAPLLERVAAAMTERGYAPRDVMGLHLALEEAIVNALHHGNGNDPRKRVVVRYAVGPEEVLAEVEDEGRGFYPELVPDPTAPENRDKECGRGLLLMRHFTTWVRFHGRGNRVTLCKRFTAPAAEA
jgi:serine/threonine-protein kinase RsbW